MLTPRNLSRLFFDLVQSGYTVSVLENGLNRDEEWGQRGDI